MIDWFSGLIAHDASELKLGKVYEVSPDGEVTWSKDSWLKCRGSYESTIQVRRESPVESMRNLAEKLKIECPPNCLQVSGNPTKFLQGHNAFGCEARKASQLLYYVSKKLPGICIEPKIESKSIVPVHSSRIDITIMCEMPGHSDVHAWLNKAASETRSRHGRPIQSGHTVYWGQHSRRWSIKAYCKYCELKAHPCSDLKLNDLLQSYVMPQVRLELTLRTKELAKIKELSENLVWSYMDKLTFGGLEVEKVTTGYDELKPRAKDVLDLWLRGCLLKHRYSRTTFYRYRCQIMEETGIDISIDRKGVQDEIERSMYDLDYLKQHEVKNVPDELRVHLFDPAKIVLN